MTKQSIGNGSSDRVFMWKTTRRTRKGSSVERLGYFSRLFCLEWRAMKGHLSTAESWVAAAHSVCSPLTAHLQAGTAAAARRVWLPHYCSCSWCEWIDTPRFFLRSAVQIHSHKRNEGLWERAGTHEQHWFTLNAGRTCRSLYLLSSLFACVYSNWIFQQVPCNFQKDQWGWATAEAAWKVNAQTPFPASMRQ